MSNYKKLNKTFEKIINKQPKTAKTHEIIYQSLFFGLCYAFIY